MTGQTSASSHYLRPAALSCIGDVAFAIGPHFAANVGAAKQMLVTMAQSASATLVMGEQGGNEEQEDYGEQLLVSVLEAFTSMLNGVKTEQDGAKRGGGDLHALTSWQRRFCPWRRVC
jgi:hypothetical protein